VSRIKVIALLEAQVITGPAKNLLRFAADCRDRVELTIVTFVRTSNKNLNNTSDNQFISAARNLDIAIEIIRETGPFDLSALGALGRIFERTNADVVQTHGIKSHFLISLLPRRRFRWIAFHHGYTSEDFKARCYHQFDRWSLRFCDLVVTVCMEFANVLASRGVPRDRISVIPNSIEVDVSHPDAELSKKIRRQWSISDDECVVLSIGRLSREKGHRYLIDAISRIVCASHKIKFQALITGDGPALRKLKKQVHRKGLGQCIKFTGYCSNTRALFSMADLFVLPSLSEGSPNVLLESMAARVAIVATNVGGVPELVTNDESAILVPPANSELLAQSMIELLTNRSRAIQLADAAFDKVRLAYCTTKYDERLLNIYNRLMGKEHTCV
jgi:glycosyltransferase involved in cell wall biosynthesis